MKLLLKDISSNKGLYVFMVMYVACGAIVDYFTGQHIALSALLVISFLVFYRVNYKPWQIQKTVIPFSMTLGSVGVMAFSAVSLLAKDGNFGANQYAVIAYVTFFLVVVLRQLLEFKGIALYPELNRNGWDLIRCEDGANVSYSLVLLEDSTFASLESVWVHICFCASHYNPDAMAIRMQLMKGKNCAYPKTGFYHGHE